MFVVLISANFMLRQLPPPFKHFTINEPEPVAKRQRSQIVIDQILHNDPFGTIAPPLTKTATAQNLVTPIPDIPVAQVPQVPDIKKPEMMATLQLTLDGIVVASEEAANIALIADETGKESIYRVGDKYKDACLIKMTQNRVVFLRANGQQEVFYLRKTDQLFAKNAATEWQYVVKKIDDTTVSIDPKNFTSMFGSLGELFEKFGAVPAFSKGTSLGIKIMSFPSPEMGAALNLAQGDIITAINKIPAVDTQGRMKIYDYLTALKENDTFPIDIKRKDAVVSITCKITPLEKPNKWAALLGAKTDSTSTQSGGSAVAVPTPAQALNSPNNYQQQAQAQASFDQTHENDFQSAMLEIRKRLVENMKTRGNNTRIR